MVVVEFALLVLRAAVADSHHLGVLERLSRVRRLACWQRLPRRASSALDFGSDCIVERFFWLPYSAAGRRFLLFERVDLINTGRRERGRQTSPESW